MKVEVLLAICAIPLVGGIVTTRIWVKRRERGAISDRLARFSTTINQTKPRTLLKEQKQVSFGSISQYFLNFQGIEAISALLIEAGLEDRIQVFLIFWAVSLVLPIFLAFTFDFNPLFALLSAGALVVLSVIVLKAKAEARRTKFCEQLPDAIDLMVAVLRSGHSVSQSVKAVAKEIPSPCGTEYETILHRMNLGQPLSESLILSSKRFRSYELDLMRRAVAIQAEVGGSLAELLEKTNYTLRQRLKLARQLRVITTQSRLSAHIVGILPILLALGLNIINPGYLQLLFQDKLGQSMLVGAIVLQIVGILVMRRMSTMKV